jgi:hypothetical protein
MPDAANSTTRCSDGVNRTSCWGATLVRAEFGARARSAHSGAPLVSKASNAAWRGRSPGVDVAGAGQAAGCGRVRTAWAADHRRTGCGPRPPVANSSTVLFLGRHVGYPVTLERVLKLKELAYMHPEVLRPVRSSTVRSCWSKSPRYQCFSSRYCRPSRYRCLPRRWHRPAGYDVDEPRNLAKSVTVE